MTAKKCVYPACKYDPHSRGLCENHYQQVRRMIREGVADDDDLVQRRLMLPAKNRTSPLFKKGNTTKGRG